MKLNVLERITLMGILPASENYVTYKIITEFKAALSFSEEEIKDFEMVVEKDQVNWNPTKAREKEFVIGESLAKIISSALKKADEEKKIDDANASLYEKFVLTIN